VNLYRFFMYLSPMSTLVLWIMNSLRFSGPLFKTTALGAYAVTYPLHSIPILIQSSSVLVPSGILTPRFLKAMRSSVFGEMRDSLWCMA